jgi:hypothetical protein
MCRSHALRPGPNGGSAPPGPSQPGTVDCVLVGSCARPIELQLAHEIKQREAFMSSTPNRHISEVIGTLMACAVVAACGSAPMSLLEGKPPLAILPANHFPVRVVSVDGSIQFQMPVRVAPGARTLVLEAPGRMGTRSAVQRTFAFKVEPCTQYHLLAAKESLTSVTWELVIHSKEKVTACNPEEELKKSWLIGGPAVARTSTASTA